MESTLATLSDLLSLNPRTVVVIVGKVGVLRLSRKLKRSRGEGGQIKLRGYIVEGQVGEKESTS